jgi:hypothetical protein
VANQRYRSSHNQSQGNVMKLLNRLFCLVMWVPASQAAMAAQPSPLAGTWTLVAADIIRPDGVRERDYGTAPKGLMMIDARIIEAAGRASAAGHAAHGRPAPGKPAPP